MTSLFSNTMSPAKDDCSSLPHRASNLGKPPLRALYDLLIAPMEGVSVTFLRLEALRHGGANTHSIFIFLTADLYAYHFVQ